MSTILISTKVTGTMDADDKRAMVARIRASQATKVPATCTVQWDVRAAMTLLEDNVDQQTALTPQQRVIVRAIADGVLTESRELIENEFATWSPIDDHDDDGLK